MNIISIKNPFFTPFSNKNNNVDKSTSMIVTLALSILTLGIYLAVFLYKRHKISQKVEKLNIQNLSDSSLETFISQTTNKACKRQFNSLVAALEAKSKNVKYVGTESHIKIIYTQVQLFQAYEKTQNFNQLRSDHFDWWMFPIPESSLRKRHLYKVEESDTAALLSNEHFRQLYLEGIRIVSLGWGWDIKNGQTANNRQSYNDYSVRVYKMHRSLTHFLQFKTSMSHEYFSKLETYKQNLETFIKKHNISINYQYQTLDNKIISVAFPN